MMSSGGRMTSLSGVMRDAILQLCRANFAYGGHLEVDGIICISGQDENQQIVVKVHEKLFPEVELQKQAREHEHLGGRVDKNEIPIAKRPRVEMEKDETDSLIDVENETDDGRGPMEEDIEVEGVHLGRKRKEAVPYIKQEPEESTSPLAHPLMSSTPELPPGAIDLSTARFTESPFSDGESQGYPEGYAESRLRSLLTHRHQAMHRPHNMLPFLPRRPVYPTSPSMIMGAPSPECKVCGLIISETELLREHNETHHGVFTCRICYRTFTSRSNLERHSRLHTGHKPYICSKCGKAFSRKDHLTNHSAKHAFKCGKCLKRFVEKESLRAHYHKDHHCELTDICTHCNKGFTDHRVYTEHMKSHPENFPGGQRPLKDDHMMLQMKTRRYTHKCSECGMMYADPLDLSRHLHNIHMLFFCLGCYESFADPIMYSQHFISHQGEANIFECFACRQICTTYEELREHEQSHSGSKAHMLISDLSGETDTYLCPYCAKVFPNEALLMEHVSIHEGLQRNTCNVCGKRFDSISKLEEHQDQHQTANRHNQSDGSDHKTSPAPSSTRERSQSPIRRRAEEGDKNNSNERNYEISDDDEDEHSQNFVITENPTKVIEIGGVRSSMKTDSESPSHVVELTGDQHSDMSSLDQDTPDKSSETSVAGLENSHSAEAGSSGEDDKHWYSIRNHNNAYMIPVPIGGFICSICGIRLPTFKDYENHCFASHYRYPCMYCPKTFAQRPNRDRHVCIHTGEKPFSCPECGQKFSRGDKLKLHRMKAHKLDYPGPYVRLKDINASSTQTSHHDEEDQ